MRTLCDNDAVVELIANARFIARRERLKTVNGVYFGTDCTGIHIVPVPIVDTPGHDLRPVDAMFRTYVRPPVSQQTSVLNMEPWYTEVDDFPRGTNVPSPFRYAVYSSNTTLDRPNLLIPRLHGAEKFDINGPLLVLKSDREDNALAINETEIYFIQRMIVEAIASDRIKRFDL